MKANKFFKAFMLVGMLALVSPATFAASTEPTAIEHREEIANRLKSRLEEIRAMDTKNMTKSEKKALRTEVKTIKKELAQISGGVYLSVGAIILIALLLILLL